MPDGKSRKGGALGFVCDEVGKLRDELFRQVAPKGGDRTRCRNGDMLGPTSVGIKYQPYVQ